MPSVILGFFSSPTGIVYDYAPGRKMSWSDPGGTVNTQQAIFVKSVSSIAYTVLVATRKIIITIISDT